MRQLGFSSGAWCVEKFQVVLSTICIIVLVSGNFIHYLEPETFPNAFLGCWWSLVTMTTVDYGDMVPQTLTGKAAAAVLILMGITLFALLTGSITVKLNEFIQTKKACKLCQRMMPLDGDFCPYCGHKQADADLLLAPLTHKP